MSTWVTILSIAAVVFASRFLLSEPWLPLSLGNTTKQILSYSAPAVLTAIAAPIIFIREREINLSTENQHLIAGVIVISLALLTRNTLLTVILGMFCFLVLKHWL